MRNDPPGTTPLRKLIAPPERTVQIVSVISNHGDVQPLLVLSLRGLRSLFPLSFLPPFSASPPSGYEAILRSPFRSPFEREYACRSVPPNLFAREIFLRVVSLAEAHPDTWPATSDHVQARFLSLLTFDLYKSEICSSDLLKFARNIPLLLLI